MLKSKNNIITVRINTQKQHITRKNKQQYKEVKKKCLSLKKRNKFPQFLKFFLSITRTFDNSNFLTTRTVYNCEDEHLYNHMKQEKDNCKEVKKGVCFKKKKNSSHLGSGL